MLTVFLICRHLWGEECRKRMITYIGNFMNRVVDKLSDVENGKRFDTIWKKMVKFNYMIYLKIQRRNSIYQISIQI